MDLFMHFDLFPSIRYHRQGFKLPHLFAHRHIPLPKDTEPLRTSIRYKRKLSMRKGLRSSNDIRALKDMFCIRLTGLVALNQLHPSRVVVGGDLIGPHRSRNEAMNSHSAGKIPSEILSIDYDFGYGPGQSEFDDGPVDVAGGAGPGCFPAVTHVLPAAREEEVAARGVVLV
jgi:hypothetical protein